ncbi:hypothetical protein VL07_09915 [Bacillus safensis]|uniref:hypothetical protein n=1 Tax=Bacillus safensis TaxID=561879 RepID=UPI0006516F45|nr:hypothetical protein [Bacillus safensis]KML11445.1 hypothetical protein VL07_09915 [Bacillus safensis]KML52338.1 hypothetical protein VL18_05360 [Bacillus safensis]KMN77566.1 hypothetical protein VK99_15580 [Bacillus safensis]
MFKKTLLILITLALVMSIWTPFSSEASAETHFINSQELEALVTPTVLQNEQATKELDELEMKMGEYIENLPFTEKEFENMSESAQNKLIDQYFNNEEFLSLENRMTQLDSKSNQSEITTQALPVFFVPIAMTVGRVALWAIRSKGAKVALKYLKNRIKGFGKNYHIDWYVKNRKGKVESLVKVFHKKGKKKIRVFAVDNGVIPLKPGSSNWYWHFHVAPKIQIHHALRASVPSKHKAVKGRTILH